MTSQRAKNRTGNQPLLDAPVANTPEPQELASQGSGDSIPKEMKNRASVTKKLDNEMKQVKRQAKPRKQPIVTDPQPRARNSTTKRERQPFPGEKFGRSVPDSPEQFVGYQGPSSTTTKNGLSNSFPTEKFRGENAHSGPGAHPHRHVRQTNRSTVPVPAPIAGRLESGNADSKQALYQNQEPEQVLYPNQEAEYLVQASLVVDEDDPKTKESSVVVEAQEVTISDIFKIKGVCFVFGTMICCFLLILVALIAALVMVTRGNTDSGVVNAQPTQTASSNERTSEPSHFAPTAAPGGDNLFVGSVFDDDSPELSDLFFTSAPSLFPLEGATQQPTWAPLPPPVEPPTSAMDSFPSEPSEMTEAPLEEEFFGDDTNSPESSTSTVQTTAAPIIICLVIVVAFAMLLSVPLFLWFMRRKLQEKLRKESQAKPSKSVDMSTSPPGDKV
jgi:hypothetical protein